MQRYKIENLAFDVLPTAGRQFATGRLGGGDLIAIDAINELSERIVLDGRLGHNVTVVIGDNMLNSDNWKLIIRGRGNQKINNLRIIISSFSGRIIVGCPDGEGALVMGACGHFNANIFLAMHSHVIIGDHCTCNGAEILNFQSHTYIGKDCMIAKDIVVHSSDQHSIVDIDSMSITNRPKRSVEIQDHVWIGRNATILPSTTIGRGAIVGAAAVVSNNVPEFCAVAGNPARVIRKRVSWSRPINSIDEATKKFLLASR